MFLLPRQIAAIDRIVAKDDIRRAITGVLIRQIPNAVEVMATNGKCLVRATIPQRDNPADFPQVPGFNAGADGVSEILLPGGVLSKIAKEIPRGRMVRSTPILNNIAMTIHGTKEQPQATLATTDLEMPRVTTVKAQEGKFPDFESVYLGEPAFSIMVDADLMADTMKTVADLAGRDGIRSVRLDFCTSDGAFQISANNPNGVLVSAVQMPVVGGKDRVINPCGKAEQIPEPEWMRKPVPEPEAAPPSTEPNLRNPSRRVAVPKVEGGESA